VLLVIGAVVALGGLGAVTRQALTLEAGERRAQEDAKFQEALRLALWRMDSAMTPIIAREAARPYYEYQAFYPADRAFSNMLEPAPGAWGLGGEGSQPDGASITLVPSPLLSARDSHFYLHFQRDASGRVTSPQAPQAERLILAEGAYVTPYTAQLSQSRLDEVTRLLASASDPQGPPSRRFVSSLRLHDSVPPSEESARADPARTDLAKADRDEPARETRERSAEREQQQRAGEEYFARKKVAQEAQSNVAPAAQGLSSSERRPAEVKNEFPPALAAMDAAAPATPVLQVDRDQAVVQGEFVARWVDGERGAPELLFVREVRVGGNRYEQGFWVDWTVLRSMLLEQTRGILPGATLVPVVGASGSPSASDAETLGRMLATVPAQLIVAQPADARPPAWTPLKTTLVATWALVLASLAGLGVVVRASTELAERRGRFVSAVTHELRTPLTTFRLYSQMLAEGMVAEDARRGYARTLFDESGRLTRIVESVLEYARMGRAPGDVREEQVTVASLRERLAPVLGAIAQGAGARIAWVGPDEALAQRTIRTDPAQVERIVANLVDNACKYATPDATIPPADPPQPRDELRATIELSFLAREAGLAIRVRDFGPGIPARDARRIFRAFVRGERHAHGSVPGMGLGLALSRGLAEQLGGELTLVDANPGAAFELRLAL
jgi:signal transduction histidine kinase